MRSLFPEPFPKYSIIDCQKFLFTGQVSDCGRCNFHKTTLGMVGTSYSTMQPHWYGFLCAVSSLASVEMPQDPHLPHLHSHMLLLYTYSKAGQVVQPALKQAANHMEPI